LEGTFKGHPVQPSPTTTSRDIIPEYLLGSPVSDHDIWKMTINQICHSDPTTTVILLLWSGGWVGGRQGRQRNIQTV